MLHSCAALTLTVLAAGAAEPIRLARTPDVAPDGKQVVFSYLGDLWSVESAGGMARPLTQHVAHDYHPVYSPDGKTLAFASNRHGSYDVFVMPAQGGRPRRLTFDSAADVPTGWTPDGKHVLFASNRGPAYPSSTELYRVPVEGGRVKQVSAAEGRQGVLSPDGKRLAYVRGPGEWFRKGYRGSANDELWLADTAGTNNRRLTDFQGQDGSPMWAQGGKSLYYVSECFGTPANLVKIDPDDPKAKPVLVTAKDGKPLHGEDGVRLARISAGGDWIVYECGPDLWLLSTAPGSKPRRLAIEAHADDKTNPERTATYTGNATEFALSRDERHIAIVVHGEIFLMAVSSKGTTVRATDSPANDRGVAWAPDASKIVFISDRDGYDDLFLLESDDPDHPRLVEAHRFKATPLTRTREAEAGVSFSPDGSRVAFLRGGRLCTIKPDGTNLKVLVEKPEVIDYEWSPDGKWVVYSRMDGSFASELYIMPADGGESKNVTRFATMNLGVTWSADGKKLCFLSSRKGNSSRGLYVMSLQKEAAPGAVGGDDIDFDDIHHRVAQPATMTVREGAISLDGQRVAFAAGGSGNDDLWVASTSGGAVVRVTTGDVKPTQITWSRRLPSLLYYRDGQGTVRLARIPDNPFAPATPPPGTAPAVPATPPTPVLTAQVPFKARLTINDPETFTQMFDQGWRALADSFYDPKLNGTDWEAIRNRYRPLVRHVSMKEDLYALMYLMLGELNASHLGVAGQSPPPEEATADLGLIFDDAYEGRGFKVSEVLKRGPADRRGMRIKAGDYVLSVDGVEVKPDTNLSRLLNARAGEAVTLLVSSDPGAALNDKLGVRRVELTPVKREDAQKLHYERWVEQNARRVSERSKGTLGYIHIPSMDEEGLERFIRSLYSDNFDKEAIVLDVRFNGGGFTHDQVLNYLGSREHTFFRHRHGTEGLVIRSYDRKWTRPLVLLINNRSYSDAEILPHAFRTLGLGKLVGQATGGHVIGTAGVRLIDGSTFRIPRIGVYTVSGINMDREGVKPDHEVIAHPDQLARGVDAQLDRAVEVLQVEVAEWKKKKASVPTGTPLTPTAPVPSPMSMAP